MLSYLRGDQDYIHGPGEAVIYEMAGSAAIFRDGYKLTRNNPPFGNREWRLYRHEEDPAEVNELSQAEPELGVVASVAVVAPVASVSCSFREVASE